VAPADPDRCRIIDHLNFAKQAAFKLGRDVLRADIIHEEIAQPIIPKAHNHSAAS
jgi:hypothetical protein